MALVYRETKGEALTFAELDGNFQYFTGSHAITGSLVVSQAVTASFFTGSFTGTISGTASYASQALNATSATSASYFSGSSGGATFLGDVSFASGANVDGLFVVAPLTDTSITGGIQVFRGETNPNDQQYMSLNYFGGAGRVVGVNKTSDTPQFFLVLQDSTSNVNMMEFRTVASSGVGTAYIVINPAVLPTSEPPIIVTGKQIGRAHV